VKDFQLLGSLQVDAPVLSQPLVVLALNFRGEQHSVLWVATVRNTIYAFNADPPFQELTRIHLGEPYAPTKAEVDNILGGSGLMTYVDGPYPDGSPAQFGHPIIGIESTPVIDLKRKRMFVSYRTNTGLGGQQRLAAIDITTGEVKKDVAVPGSPVWHKLHRNRSSLLLNNNVVFIAFSAINEGQRQGDYSKSYQGWIHAFDASDTLGHLGSYRTVLDPDNNSGD